jgi:hypothetical protein
MFISAKNLIILLILLYELPYPDYPVNPNLNSSIYLIKAVKI